MNTQRILAFGLALVLVPMLAQAEHGKFGYYYDDPTYQPEYERVPVLFAEPIMKMVPHEQPRQRCWNEEVHTTETHGNAGAVLAGAVLGGVLGNQLGHSRDATATGAFFGAAIGASSSPRSNVTRVENVQRCTVMADYTMEEVVSGYHVTYRYHGKVYSTQMDHDPGRFLHLEVTHRAID